MIDSVMVWECRLSIPLLPVVDVVVDEERGFLVLYTDAERQCRMAFCTLQRAITSLM